MKICPYTLTVMPYDPAWPLRFAEEAARLKEALGDNCIEIYHVGSTAVPGLAAKPVLDIVPVVKDLYKVQESKGALEALGYESKGEYGIPCRRFFTKQQGMVRTHNVHVYEKGFAEIERLVKFRDWLRSHPADREAYSALKRDLASRYVDDIASYSQGKDLFVLAIDKKAGFDKLRVLFPYSATENDAYCRLEATAGWADSAYDSHARFVVYAGGLIVGICQIRLARPERINREYRIYLQSCAREHECRKYLEVVCRNWIRQQWHS